ncbi:MAG: flavodoxin reductase [Bacteroidetes bacterium]|nr:flavodoxin reductase [Bacteroidota bacterium]
MKTHIIKVRSITHITHNVLRIVTTKPPLYNFSSGQATELSINKPGWQDIKRPFTFTSPPIDNHLEFTIKTYPSRKGLTNELLKLKKSDELIIRDSWGTINYRGEGVFIAGGAGITSFISALRTLHFQNEIGDNKLIFANNTEEDIINKKEFEDMLGDNFINILFQEKSDKYEHGCLTKDFLKRNISNFNTYFYLCGPSHMEESVERILLNLKVDPKAIIKEE